MLLEKSHIESWQSTLDLLAEILDVSASLIMAADNNLLSVLVSSNNNENPYTADDTKQFSNEGSYCKKVIETNSELLVPSALKDNEWKNHPDIKLGIISYLGFPLLWPNGETFGTICVLDKKENPYSTQHRKLLEKFKTHIELDLSRITKEAEARKKNEQLAIALEEIKILKGIIPICSYCNNIRDKDGGWDRLEAYITKNSEAEFSHGICPDCFEQARTEAGRDKNNLNN